MGLSILSMVKKAARLAVYEEIMIKVKNHQELATIRDDIALDINVFLIISYGVRLGKWHLGRKSHPCCTHEAMVNHRQ